MTNEYIPSASSANAAASPASILNVRLSASNWPNISAYCLNAAVPCLPSYSVDRSRSRNWPIRFLTSGLAKNWPRWWASPVPWTISVLRDGANNPVRSGIPSSLDPATIFFWALVSCSGSINCSPNIAMAMGSRFPTNARKFSLLAVLVSPAIGSVAPNPLTLVAPPRSAIAVASSAAIVPAEVPAKINRLSSPYLASYALRVASIIIASGLKPASVEMLRSRSSGIASPCFLSSWLPVTSAKKLASVRLRSPPWPKSWELE